MRIYSHHNLVDGCIIDLAAASVGAFVCPSLEHQEYMSPLERSNLVLATEEGQVDEPVFFAHQESQLQG